MTRGQAVLRAIFGKLNLSVVVAAAASAAVLGSWAVLTIGVLTFLGLTGWDVYMNRHRVQPTPPRLPNSSSFGNAAVRHAVEAMRLAQQERLEVLKHCPEEVLLMLQSILTTAVNVELAAIRLAQRTDQLSNYLATKNSAQVQAELASAQESARAAKTARERRNYENAARTYQVQLETLSGIDLGIRVAVAKLENIKATLVAVPPRVVKLRAMGSDVADTLYARLSEDLRNANDELAEAEERLNILAQSADDVSQYVRIGPSSDRARIETLQDEFLGDSVGSDEKSRLERGSRP